MRRVISLFICTAFVLAAIACYLVVATVATALATGLAGAMAEIGAFINTIAIIFAIPVLALSAWVLSAADWPTCIGLLGLLLKLLGLQ
jgi:hypothetical protein